MTALVLALVGTALLGCSNGIGGLQRYTSTVEGYEFLYPNGWVEVGIQNDTSGIDVVLHDIVEVSENVSVVVNEVPDDRTLTDLGSPSEVGYRLLKNAIAPPESDREAELLRAELGQAEGQTYYKLEYQVTLADGRERHNLANVAVSRGKLFTLNVSVPQRRWNRLPALFEAMVNSFKVY